MPIDTQATREAAEQAIKEAAGGYADRETGEMAGLLLSALDELEQLRRGIERLDKRLADEGTLAFSWQYSKCSLAEIITKLGGPSE